MESMPGPSFVLNASKICNPKELIEKTKESLAAQGPAKSPPITPAPSASNTEDITDVKNPVKHKKPSANNKINDSSRQKMELIKERLERSRARYKERMELQNASTLPREPTDAGFNDPCAIAGRLDRSVSDMAPINRTRPSATGELPYVYFVIDQGVGGTREIPFDDALASIRLSKSAEKRKKVRILEQHKQKKEKAGKMPGLARELGLKSNPHTVKQPDFGKSATQPFLNQIEFPQDGVIPRHGHVFQGAVPSPPSTAPNVHSIHSPLRTLRGRSAMAAGHEPRLDFSHEPDPDDNVPRKPFISGPMYSGKSRPHPCSMQTFELPLIAPEQRRHPLASEKYADDVYPCFKPPSALRQRQVTFTDSLPVIRGSGFVLNERDLKEDSSVMIIPNIGPRAATMGSIVLPSEDRDRQEVCQRFAMRDNQSVKMAKKAGIHLPLPKVDIVSTVHDEMIIKMVNDYLHDPGTSERQAQLARELLGQLQQNEPPMEDRKPDDTTSARRSRVDRLNQEMERQQKKPDDTTSARRSGVDRLNPDKERQKTVTVKHVTLTVPVNGAEDVSPSPVTPKTNILTPTTDGTDEVPFVQITYKQKPAEADKDSCEVSDSVGTLAANQRGVSARPVQERQILNVVKPTSFKMAPPGLSKEDTDSEMTFNQNENCHSAIAIKG